MAMGEFASVIEGLATMLAITHKSEMPLDYALLAQLTRGILQGTDREPAGIRPLSPEPGEEEAVELSPVVLGELEELEQLEAPENVETGETGETGETEKDRGTREFLVKKLSGLFDELQKRVRNGETVVRGSTRGTCSCTTCCMCSMRERGRRRRRWTR